MRFVYTYKTPDGVRHEAEMHAANKEAVFEALRAENIRPMKVTAKGLTPTRLALLLGILLLSALCIVLSVLLFSQSTNHQAPGTSHQPPSAAYQRLEADAALVLETHAATFKEIDFEGDVDALVKARILLANTREQLRALFAPIARTFADDPQDLAAARALYGALTLEVDADEETVDAYQLAHEEDNQDGR